ncbi:MAG: DUF6503 family protein, partial [Bacteroidota bacterium]
KIVAKAMEVHGSKVVDHARIQFNFRDKQYIATREGGQYQYERLFTDKGKRKIHDVLTNDGFRRTIDGVEADLPDERVSAFSNSVNSVIYFALLPYNLKDPAVQMKYLGEEVIDNRPYHKIKVGFQQEGGGKDFEDEFVYWIQQDTYTMDYLAYNYRTDGGGARFRSAYNVRQLKGVRFADYINYRPLDEKNMDVAQFGQLFQKRQLKELSRIELKNPQIDLLK